MKYVHSYVDEIGKLAERQYTATDVDRAGRRQDLDAQQFRREYKGAPATGEERELVRQFAQKTINLPAQKGLKLTMKQWVERLLKILETRRPEIRSKIIASLKKHLENV